MNIWIWVRLQKEQKSEYKRSELSEIINYKPSTLKTVHHTQSYIIQKLANTHDMKIFCKPLGI